ncbi:Aste57867_19758 [Aphanomyces stellatus]|uniref:Aste57867_19758 protein n=1 Tax=Aphanomyces stellatus TaxID=120398 RepID=A0A485LDC2_9STRA|nr:hypothetical protein As57867_019693 [Aphanomyces stellatus]VFT96456.1 Aste57867_19758 [Aphanomyces stellatus]
MQVLASVRIEATDVVLNTIVGAGGFADVWRGTYRGELVAIRKLHQSTMVSIAQLKSFVGEIQLLSQFDSPYVVYLIGACWTRPRTLKCVMEFMDEGSLRIIVQGLVYLHARNVIHRDLKSRNILLDSTKGTKLTDFGMSKADEHQTMTTGVGTTRWMAPEVLCETITPW